MGQKRRVMVENGVARIPLTRGYTAFVDADDYRKVTGRSWTAQPSTRPDGSVRVVYAVSFQRIEGIRRRIGLHHVIAGVPPGTLVDHRDGDGLNNRRANLRLATHAQNSRNCAKPSHNTSGVKGVCWHRGAEKWHARIRVDGKERQLGLFRCITAAALAYAKASRQLHGEFGRLA